MKHRDTDLFTDENVTYLLCQRRAERTRDGTLHKSARQLTPKVRLKLTAAERYRRQLTSAGYLPSQIDRYVTMRFPDEAPS